MSFGHTITETFCNNINTQKQTQHKLRIITVTTMQSCPAPVGKKNL
jgi:hypothetical protein